MNLPAIFAQADIESFDESSLDSKQPVKTYKLDLDTGEVYAVYVDENEAIGQAIVKAVLTTRDRYLIYTSEYGSELEYLLGKSYSDEYLNMEVYRLIDECLADYDRVAKLESVKVERTSDGLWIEITVETDLSDLITVEVTV